MSKGKGIRLNKLDGHIIVINEDGSIIWHHATESALKNDIHWQEGDKTLRLLLEVMYKQACELAQVTGRPLLLTREMRIENNPDDPNLIFTVTTRSANRD